jgi:hypothetical protein
MQDGTKWEALRLQQSLRATEEEVMSFPAGCSAYCFTFLIIH